MKDPNLKQQVGKCQTVASFGFGPRIERELTNFRDVARNIRRLLALWRRNS